MKTILIILFSMILVLGMTVCSNQIASSVEKKETIALSNKIPNESITNKTNPSEGECDEWKRIYSLLSAQDQVTLQTEGIVLVSVDKQYKNAYYFLSPELVDNCEQRIKIGQLIWLVMLEQDTKSDKQFAEKSSKEIVKVLRHIWNSPAFSRDGVSDEKYSLLTYDGIRDDDIAPFISDLLVNEGLSGTESGLESTLINRPLKSLKPVVSEFLSNAEKEDNIPQQVYFLIVLCQIDNNPQILSKLNEMTNNPKLSNKTKQELKKIVNKLKSKINIDYGDIEKLDMPLVHFEEAEN